MQTFRQLFKRKTRDEAFKALYEHECNICPYTVRIFEKVETSGVDLAQLAAELDVTVQALIDLKEADCCKPRLVIDLCHHFGLTPPPTCPKLSPGEQ